MRNKKAIELALNFIVVLIIAIVVFGMGIWMTATIYKKTKDLTGIVDQQTRDELIRALSSDKVSIVYNREEVRVGKYHTFWMGLKNVEDEKDFYVSVRQPPKYLATDETEGTYPGSLEILPLPGQPKKYHLKANDLVLVPIVVTVKGNGKSGTYILTVDVKKLSPGGDIYGTTQKVYVKVP